MATITNSIRWADNTAELKANLLQGIGTIDAMKASVDRTVESLSGNGLFQSANKVTAAVSEMGGAMGVAGGAIKLTSAEQDRINTLLDKAIEKYQAMGMKAPPEMLALAQATERVETATQHSGTEMDKFGGLVEHLTERFAVYEVLHGALDFTKEILASAAALEDLHLATGISLDGLQRLTFVGTEFGVDTATMARGVEQLSAKLANGDKNATGAVQMLGLSVKDLIAAGPEEAFVQVADAAGRIPDPMEKGGVAAELFGGKLAKQLLPMLGDVRQKMGEVPQGALISDDTIKSAHDFEVGLEHLTTRLKAYVAEGVAGLANGTLLMTSGFNVLGQSVMAVNAAFTEHKQAMDVNLPVQAAVLTNTQLLQNRIDALRKDALVPLTDEQKRNIDQLEKYGVSTAEITKLTGASEGAIKTYEDAHKKATEAIKAHTDAIQKLSDKYSGDKVSKEIADLDEALTKVSNSGPLSATGMQLAGDEAVKLFKAGGTLTPQLMALAIASGDMLPKMIPVADVFKGFTGQIKVTTPEIAKVSLALNELDPNPKVVGISNLTGAFKALEVVSLESLKKEVTDLEAPSLAAGKAVQAFEQELEKTFQLLGSESSGAMKTLFGDLSQVVKGFQEASAAGKQLGIDGKQIGDTFGIASPLFSDDATAAEKWGAAVQSAGAIASGAMAAWTAGEKAATTEGALFKGAMSGAEAGAVFGPWGAAIGAAGGALLGFIAHLGAGRKAVEDFAASFGGFDDMHAKLLTLGASGEALWVSLTQGVGKNNPTQAKAVIDEINAALAGQDAWMQRLPGLISKYGLSWEDAGNQAKQAHLDEIAQGLIQDFADLSKAGFDVTVITDKMSASINDYVHQATATGTEIPAAMKPLLQKMIDMGTLTDDAGNKLTDLSGLSFATTLTQGFKDITDAINALTLALTGGMGPALEAIGKTVVTPHIKPVIDYPDGSEGSASTAATGGYVGKTNVIPFAVGGSVFAPSGTDTVPAMLTPGEIVLNAAQQKNVAGAVGGNVANFAEFAKEMRASREDAARRDAQMAQMIARAVRDELQKATRR